MKGSFRLPTHSRDAHWNFYFLMIPSEIEIKISAKSAIYGTLCSKELQKKNIIYIYSIVDASSIYRMIRSHLSCTKHAMNASHTILYVTM